MKNKTSFDGISTLILTFKIFRTYLLVRRSAICLQYKITTVNEINETLTTSDYAMVSLEDVCVKDSKDGTPLTLLTFFSNDDHISVVT